MTKNFSKIALTGALGLTLVLTGCSQDKDGDTKEPNTTPMSVSEGVNTFSAPDNWEILSDNTEAEVTAKSPTLGKVWKTTDGLTGDEFLTIARDSYTNDGRFDITKDECLKDFCEFNATSTDKSVNVTILAWMNAEGSAARVQATSEGADTPEEPEQESQQ